MSLATEVRSGDRRWSSRRWRGRASPRGWEQELTSLNRPLIKPISVELVSLRAERDEAGPASRRNSNDNRLASRPIPMRTENKWRNCKRRFELAGRRRSQLKKQNAELETQIGGQVGCPGRRPGPSGNNWGGRVKKAIAGQPRVRQWVTLRPAREKERMSIENTHPPSPTKSSTTKIVKSPSSRSRSRAAKASTTIAAATAACPEMLNVDRRTAVIQGTHRGADCANRAKEMEAKLRETEMQLSARNEPRLPPRTSTIDRVRESKLESNGAGPQMATISEPATNAAQSAAGYRSLALHERRQGSKRQVVGRGQPGLLSCSLLHTFRVPCDRFASRVAASGPRRIG